MKEYLIIAGMILAGMFIVDFFTLKVEPSKK